MSSFSFRAVPLACLLLVANGAHAQDAGVAQPAPAQQPASSDCSGFLCMFSSHDRAAPRPSPAQPVALAPAAEPNAPTVEQTPAADRLPHASRETAKPVSPITIAVAPAEKNRLKMLATVLPRTKVHFVEPAAARKADFVIKMSSDEDRSAERVRLFSERMYVVAGGAIHSLSDLRDKVVSFGPSGDPTGIAARKAFAALNIPVKETALDFDNALDGLATGDIDAVVMLAPEPSGRLRAIQAPGVHLVSWPEGAPAPDGAALSAVDIKDYPHLAADGSAIRAMDVDAVLDVNKNARGKPIVKRFLASLGQHSAELSKAGFDRLRADLRVQGDRQVASAERR